MKLFRLLTLYLAGIALSLGQGIDGVWLGTLKGENSSTPVLFVLEKDGAGKLGGQVISAARQVSHKLDPVSSDGSKVRFGVPGVDSSYEGTLAADGESIDGVWTEPGSRQPLKLSRYKKTSFNLPIGTEIDAFVPKPPANVRAGGRYHLMYELHVTNWSDLDARIDRLEVIIDGKTVRLEGEPLRMLTLSRNLQIGPKIRTAIILMLSGSDPMKSIEHRLVVSRDGQTAPAVVRLPGVEVQQDVIRISPPVRGPDWLMNAGPDVPSHHRTSLLAVNGRITNPQRYAFDLHKVRDPGDVKRTNVLTDYPTYGQEVVAVADATVAAVQDGIADGIPHGMAAPVTINIETILGNQVALDLGGGRYAVYAHLQPGLKVRKGDRVSRGQVLGKIGNSGRSNAPHLHFQVADGPAMDAEGVPWLFDSFEKDGVQYTNEMPLHGWRVNFPRP